MKSFLSLTVAKVAFNRGVDFGVSLANVKTVENISPQAFRESFQYIQNKISNNEENNT